MNVLCNVPLWNCTAVTLLCTHCATLHKLSIFPFFLSHCTIFVLAIDLSVYITAVRTQMLKARNRYYVHESCFRISIGMCLPLQSGNQPVHLVCYVALSRWIRNSCITIILAFRKEHNLPPYLNKLISPIFFCLHVCIDIIWTYKWYLLLYVPFIKVSVTNVLSSLFLPSTPFTSWKSLKMYFIHL